MPDPSRAASTPPKAPDHRPRIGRIGEQHARAHLLRLGYTLLAERARTRWGEIDLIVHDRTTIVFCEVKTRVARRHGSAWTSLTERKRAQVRRLAVAWLADTPSRPRCDGLRFDAIEVLVGPDGDLVGLEHLEAAF